MTKNEALNLYGGSVRALADALGITEQAVHQWGEEVPALRRYQLLDIEARKNA